MVRGVTRRIVEIRETGSNYFERAIFFVNMEASRGASEYTLSQEARRIIDSLSTDKALSPRGVKAQRKVLFHSVLRMLGAAAAGVFTTLLFTRII